MNMYRVHVVWRRGSYRGDEHEYLNLTTSSAASARRCATEICESRGHRFVIRRPTVLIGKDV